MMKAHLKKNASNYGIAIAIATSMTSVILNHFFPTGDTEARDKVVASHNAVSNVIDENNRVISDEIDKLEARVDSERAKRRELEDKVRALEDETRYFHGNNNHHVLSDVRSEESLNDVDDDSGSGVVNDMANKMRPVAPLEKF